MSGQIVAGIGHVGKRVAEARAIVNISRGIRAPWKGNVPPNIQGIALVVVQRAQAGARITKRSGVTQQPSGDKAAAVGNLVGIGEMKLPAMRNPRRSQGKLPPANERLLNRQRKEQVRFSDDIMIKEIVDARAKCVGVEGPSMQRHSNAKLEFFISLTVQRDELT